MYMKTLNRYITLLVLVLLANSAISHVNGQTLHMYKGSKHQKGYLTSSIDSLKFEENGSETQISLYKDNIKFNAGALGRIDSMYVSDAKYDGEGNKLNILDLDLMGNLNDIPSQLSQGYFIFGKQEHETDMSYPAYMIAQTQLLGDMYPGSADNVVYDWYKTYNVVDKNMSSNSYPAYLTWYTFYKYIDKANQILAITKEVSADDVNSYTNAVAAVARVYRAFSYYMLTVLYEPKENIYTDCSNVLGLTVPIVTENTTTEQAANNPRATHDEMIEFILEDLDAAEEALKAYDFNNLKIPNLAVVYGIRAKVHLWDEDYENAAKYARLAIDTSGAAPEGDNQWLNWGFTEATQGWMWYTSYDVNKMGNLCNFVGWMSPEAEWGYSSLTMPVIDRSLYDVISDTDFRKQSFVDPDRNKYNYEVARGSDWLTDKPDYLALKFRCKYHAVEDYRIGAVSDVPIMRVEEMYLIEAEAVGMSRGLEEGKELLNNFVRSYRDVSYSCNATTLRTFQFNVLTQMRIEFWGEGNAFPLAKRLQFGVVQNYSGTNAPDESYKINCEGIKPTWNMVIPNAAMEKNVALINNPDPTNTVEYPSEIDMSIYEKYNDNNNNDEWSEWEKVGTCTYNLAGYWSGTHSDLPLYYRECLLNDIDAQFHLEGVANEMNLTINYNRQTGECQVPVHFVTEDQTFGPVYVSDIPHYPLQSGLTYEKYPCTYNAETGTFSLNLIYFISTELGSTADGYFTIGVETIQRDGFYVPDTRITGAPIEDYVGEWSVTATWEGKVSSYVGNIQQVEIDGDVYLLGTGFSGPLGADIGYDDSFLMLYDAETGLITMPAQNCADLEYDGNTYNTILGLCDSESGQIYGSGALVGGFNKDGKIVFTNHPDNSVQYDSWMFYAIDFSVISDFIGLELAPATEVSEAPAKTLELRGFKGGLKKIDTSNVIDVKDNIMKVNKSFMLNANELKQF